MKDGWFYLIAAVNIVAVLLFAKKPRDAKGITLLVWLGIGTVFLLGVAVVAAAEGDLTKAGKAILVLLGIFTITGVIPVWLIQAYESLRSRKKKEPIQPPVPTRGNGT